MAESYVGEGLAEREATFSLFFRSLPTGWSYTHAAGLDDALHYLEDLAFSEDELAYLEQTGLFTARLLDRLRRLRFSGEVRAMPEGTIVFPHEPLLEVTAPLVEAQLVETMVLNELHLQTLVAGKAARCVEAARGRLLVDFSLRRTHGGEAGLKVARASWIAGFDATSNVLAGLRFGIPLAGTMAHSYVESFADERAAFDAYARTYPETAILLVDTYDTLQGVHKAIATARDLAADGHRLRGIRLDSGDLLELSRRARALLDEVGFEDAMILASGGLDEIDIARLVDAGAPIGGFGVGTKLEASSSAPFLDMAYKLVELDGRPVLKLSAGRATLPGRKQVWRREGVRRHRPRRRARRGHTAARLRDGGRSPHRTRAAGGDPCASAGGARHGSGGGPRNAHRPGARAPPGVAGKRALRFGRAARCRSRRRRDRGDP